MPSAPEAWWLDLQRLIEDGVAAAGPCPEERPVHRIEDDTWPLGARALCERLSLGGDRPAPHGWHFYTDRPATVTCRDCLEWMHA